MESFLFDFFSHVFVPTEGQSKINKFEVKVLLIEEEDVFQFKVAMADVLTMEVV